MSRGNAHLGHLEPAHPAKETARRDPLVGLVAWDLPVLTLLIWRVGAVTAPCLLRPYSILLTVSSYRAINIISRIGPRPEKLLGERRPPARSCWGVFKSAWNLSSERRFYLKALWRALCGREPELPLFWSLPRRHLGASEGWASRTPRFLCSWLPGTVFWVRLGNSGRLSWGQRKNGLGQGGKLPVRLGGQAPTTP